MYKHLLIATDGSELAQKGVDHGLALAKAFGARVCALTVTGLLPGYAGLGAWVPSADLIATYEAEEKTAAERILAPVREAAEALGVAIETLHLLGPVPAEAIVETARTRDCDLIVMASHGRRGIRRFLLGSETIEVLVRSAVPVLVVR